MSEPYLSNQQGYFSQGPVPDYQMTPAQNAMKRSFGTTWFLLAAIVYGALFLVNLISLAVSGTGYNSAIQSLEQMYPQLAPYFEQVLSSVTTWAIILSGIIGGLYALGYFLVYFSAKSRRNPQKTAGYTILQVYAIIAMVLCIVLIAIYLTAMIVVLANKDLASSLNGLFGQGAIPPELRGYAGALIAVVIAIVIVMLLLACIYYAKTAKIYAACKDVIRDGRTSRGVSAYVLVINDILVVFMVISLIAALAGGQTGDAGGKVISMLTIILRAAFRVCLNVTYTKARYEFNQLNQNYTNYNSYNYDTGVYNTGSFQTGPVRQNSEGSYGSDQYQAGAYQNGQYSQNPYNQNPYGQNAYGQAPYGQNAYGQNAYGQAPYGQNAYGQNPYSQNPYGQAPYQPDQNAQNTPDQTGFSQAGADTAAQSPDPADVSSSESEPGQDPFSQGN